MNDFIYEVYRWAGKLEGVFEGVYHRALRSANEAERTRRNSLARGFTLYHFQISPYSAKVRNELARLQVDVPMRDILEDPKALEELLAGGKKDQVPCLRIETPGQPTRWMYESGEIVSFLRQAIR
jgi:hypothetical protein